MSRRTLKVSVTTGGHFTPGCWRPDKARGVPLPSGPDGPIVRRDPDTVSASDTRNRDPRTAANIAAKVEAFAPRRYRPGGAS
jgi:hypothetical protein